MRLGRVVGACYASTGPLDMELDFRDILHALMVIASLVCVVCALWYFVNRHRRKRLAPDEEGQASRVAHSIGEAQWSLWRLSTWRWGNLFWSSQRMPESRVLDRRRRRQRRQRRQRHSEAAEAAEAAESRGSSAEDSRTDDRSPR